MCLKMFSSNENNSGTVPAFLSKLWMLVEDRTYDDLISWGMNGRSFHVHDQVRFAKEILPLYFKHNNIASFIRQLNMYGFRKVVNLEQGSLKTEKDDLQFQHNYFVREQEKLLEMIKRKVPNVKLEAAKLSPEDFGKLLTDVKVWKTKQNHINLKLETMKRQNDALWREVASLRQKHKQQQQIVNKLIQLLITFVQHNRSLTNMKRQLPRMIEEAPEVQEAAVVPAKRSHFSKRLSIEENSEQSSPQLFIKGDLLSAASTESLPSATVTPPSYTAAIQDIQDVMLSKANTGHCPTIVEISDEDIAEHQAKINNFQMDEIDASRLLNEDVVLSSSTGAVNDSPVSTERVGQDLILASPEAEREALAEQLDSIQVDLDDLQGMLSDSGGSYNLDTNSLFAFFGQDTTQSLPSGGWQDTLLNGLEEEQAKPSNVRGCELIQYTPGDLSCWLDESPSLESDEDDDFIDTQLNTPDSSLDKEVELPSSTGKRKKILKD